MRTNLFREESKILVWYAKALVRIFWRGAREFFFSLQDYYYDKKFGIETFFEDESKDEASLYRDGDVYGASDYFEIWRAIEHLKPGASDVVMDVGCGKGRVVYCLAKTPAKKIVGLELRKNLLSIAEANIKKLSPLASKVEFVQGDAATCALDGETIYFIYNPFGWKTFCRFMQNVRESMARNPRAVRVVYYGPYKDFLDAEDWLVPDGRVRATDIHVWRLR